MTITSTPGATIIRTALMRINVPGRVATTMTPAEWAIVHTVGIAAPGRVYGPVYVRRLDSGALVLEETIVSYEDNDGAGSINTVVLCGIWKGAVWHEGHPLFVTRGRRQLRRTLWGRAGGWSVPA